MPDQLVAPWLSARGRVSAPAARPLHLDALDPAVAGDRRPEVHRPHVGHVPGGSWGKLLDQVGGDFQSESEPHPCLRSQPLRPFDRPQLGSSKGPSPEDLGPSHNGRSRGRAPL